MTIHGHLIELLETPLKIHVLGFEFIVRLKSNAARTSKQKLRSTFGKCKLHFGPGPNWTKPDSTWLTVDADPDRGDIVVDWNYDQHIPLPDDSVESIYGSHVFEHMSVFAAPRIFEECVFSRSAV